MPDRIRDPKQPTGSGDDTDIDQSLSPDVQSPFIPELRDPRTLQRHFIDGSIRPFSPTGSGMSCRTGSSSLSSSSLRGNVNANVQVLPYPPSRERLIRDILARRGLPQLNVEISRGGNVNTQAATSQASSSQVAASQASTSQASTSQASASQVVAGQAAARQAAAATRTEFIAKRARNLWLNYEACFIFLMCLLFTPCYQYFFFKPKWMINTLPDIEFNLDRARCIFVKTNVTFPENCIHEKEARFLDRTIVYNYCRSSLKNVFMYDCEKNESKTADNLPIIGYSSFLRELNHTLQKNPIDNATLADLNNVCVQVFKNNPFGDVEVRRVENRTDEHDFVYRNQALLRTQCNISPPSGSRAFAEIPLFFNIRQQFLNVAGIVVFSSLFVVVVIFILRRCYCKSSEESDSPGLSPIEPGVYGLYQRLPNLLPGEYAL